jgi:hypothetical protein
MFTFLLRGGWGVQPTSSVGSTVTCAAARVWIVVHQTSWIMPGALAVSGSAARWRSYSSVMCDSFLPRHGVTADLDRLAAHARQTQLACAHAWSVHSGLGCQPRAAGCTTASNSCTCQRCSWFSAVDSAAAVCCCCCRQALRSKQAHTGTSTLVQHTGAAGQCDDQPATVCMGSQSLFSHSKLLAVLRPLLQYYLASRP